MNKKYIYVAALLCSIVTLPGKAQQKKMIYDGQVTVLPTELKQDGDSLCLKMDIDIPVNQLKLASKRSLTLIPVLEGTNGRMTFPSIQINGKNRHKAYKRMLALEKDNEELSEAVYAVVKSGKIPTIHYTQQVPFEGWMRDAQLNMVEDLCGCGWSNITSTRSQIFNAVTLAVTEVYVPQPKMSYIQPAAEPIKNRNEVKDVFLDFRVGSAVVYKQLNNNANELQKVEGMLREIKNDKNLEIQGISFKGYASPEGSIASNLKLSDLRARSMMNFLINETGLKEIPLKAEGCGEDWEGLKKMLAGALISGKDKLLGIIEQCGTSDVCEQKFKTVDGGAAYMQLLKEIYPQLRRTACSVDYTVRGFSVEEGREIIKTHPQQLSLNEMYLVANTYPEDSEDFREIFEIAVRMFPDDSTANINAATTAIMKRDLSTAQMYLNRVKGDKRPEVANAQGVLYMLQGNYDQAEVYLNKAVAAGLSSANENLEELAHKRENDAALLKEKNR